MVALVWNPVGKQTNLPILFTRVEEEGADAFVERSFDDAKGVTPIVVAFLALSCSYFYVDATNVMAGVGRNNGWTFRLSASIFNFHYCTCSFLVVSPCILRLFNVSLLLP